MSIILASASPRRQELLHLITDDFTVISADLDESLIIAPDAVSLCQKLSVEKCKFVSAQHQNDIIIACDTVVELDGVALGKPKDEPAAEQILTALSSRTHSVHTGVSIFKNDRITTFCETTKVEFATIEHDEILKYIKTSEPYDKAGGYGIQGWAAKYITRIDGCFFNVMGLPVAKLYENMHKLSIV